MQNINIWRSQINGSYKLDNQRCHDITTTLHMSQTHTGVNNHLTLWKCCAQTNINISISNMSIHIHISLEQRRGCSRGQQRGPVIGNGGPLVQDSRVNLKFAYTSRTWATCTLSMRSGVCWIESWTRSFGCGWFVRNHFLETWTRETREKMSVRKLCFFVLWADLSRCYCIQSVCRDKIFEWDSFPTIIDIW